MATLDSSANKTLANVGDSFVVPVPKGYIPTSGVLSIQGDFNGTVSFTANTTGVYAAKTLTGLGSTISASSFTSAGGFSNGPASYTIPNIQGSVQVAVTAITRGKVVVSWVMRARDVVQHSADHGYGGVDELPATLYTSGNSFAAATKNNAGNTYLIRGVDTVDSRIFVHDSTNGLFKQSSDWGATFSNSKGIPTSVTAAVGMGKIVRFGDYLYGVCVDTGTTLVKISRTLPASGNNAFTWADMFSAPAGVTTHQGTGLNVGTQYMFYGTYGDPSAGAAIYRTSDGVTWNICYGPDATLRHVHAVMEDPYNAGHIYATMGDGTAKTMVRSTDHGTTWSTIVVSSIWQAVQISFDSKWVWLAHDSNRMTATILNRNSLTTYCAASNYHWNMAIPGTSAVTNKFYRNAYYGAVDPSTGIYYFTPNDTSSTGTTSALMYIPRPGEDAQLLDDAVIAGEVFIAGGYVWSGQYHRELLARAEVDMGVDSTWTI